MNSQLWWYTARAGGIVAWGLLAAGMIWGLLLSTKVKPLGTRLRPHWVLDLHRFLGGATIVFSTIHVAAIMLDSYVDFSPIQVLVPFTSSWQPAPVAWGIVSMYLLGAVEVTSMLRRRMSKRAWHLVHLLSFPLFGFSTIHLLTAGTDASTLPLRAATAAATAVIVGLTARRTVGADRPRTRTAEPLPMPAAVGVAPGPSKSERRPSALPACSEPARGS